METDNKETIKLLMEAFKHLQHGMHQNLYRSISPKLKPSHLFVMMRLKHSARNGVDGIRVSEIAALMGISVPAVTQILTGLEKDGYILREMDKNDRRAVRVFLTPDGTQLMETAFRHLSERFGGLFDYLGEENSLKLVSLLGEVDAYFSGGDASDFPSATQNC